MEREKNVTACSIDNPSNDRNALANMLSNSSDQTWSGLSGWLGYVKERTAPGMLKLLIFFILVTPHVARSDTRGTWDATGVCAGAPTEICGGSREAQAAYPNRAEIAGLSNCSSLYDQTLVERPLVSEVLFTYASRTNQASKSDAWCQAPGVTCVDLHPETLLTAWKSTSAVWSPIENKLILPCIAQGRIFSYDIATGSSAMLPQTPEGRPVVVRRNLDDLIVEHGEGLLIVYSRDLTSETVINLLAASNSSWGIGAVRDWHYRSGEVFALADIAPSECISPNPPEVCADAWKFALVRISLDPPVSFEPLAVMDIGALGWQYTLLANSYITEVGGAIYALIPGEPSKIIRVSQSGDLSEAAIDPSVSSALNLAGQNKADVKSLFSYAREALGVSGPGVTFPSRLLGWNGRLYLLYESVDAVEGEKEPASWKLARLDPDDSYRIMERPIQVPASSSRILVVPGRCHWAIVEHQDSAPGTGESVQKPTLIRLWQYQYVEYLP